MGMRQPARLSPTLAYGLPEDIVASQASNTSRGFGSIVALLVLVLGLAAAAVWFVALPALDTAPAGRACEVVITKSGAPACVTHPTRTGTKTPARTKRQP
jgi:hypothetical protein